MGNVGLYDRSPMVKLKFLVNSVRLKRDSVECKSLVYPSLALIDKLEPVAMRRSQVLLIHFLYDFLVLGIFSIFYTGKRYPVLLCVWGLHIFQIH
jgi:hypothetical protein